ncbi:MAG: hypothetical protein JSS81_19015 [Acidobacteria bacterium]|nr:hypothetical protein [Acidobacteriota bacterium]
MKKIIGLVFASLLVVAGLAVDASAQRRSGSRTIDGRERRQQQRIYQGIRTGRLNRREAYRLERRQYQIRRAESRYRRSGGRLTWRERYALQRRLNRSSRSIWRQKHDRQNYRRDRSYPRRRL